MSYNNDFNHAPTLEMVAPESLTENEMAILLDKLEFFEKWIKEVRSMQFCFGCD